MTRKFTQTEAIERISQNSSVILKKQTPSGSFFQFSAFFLLHIREVKQILTLLLHLKWLINISINEMRSEVEKQRLKKN